MRSLLIGSLNRGKQAEFNALLSGLDLQVVFPQAFFLELEIEETGIDYTENAQIKAQAFARASRMWTLADRRPRTDRRRPPSLPTRPAEAASPTLGCPILLRSRAGKSRRGSVPGRGKLSGGNHP